MYEKDDYRIIWQKSKVDCIKKVLNFLRSIKAERFDTAIDLSLGYQYSLLLKFAGIKHRLGFNYRKRGKFLTGKVTIDGFSDKHVVEYYLDILRLFGIDPGQYESRPKVYVTKESLNWAESFLKNKGVTEKDFVVGVIPGCGASWGKDADYRRWDKGGFASVCDSVIDRYGAKVVLFGDSKEVEICREVQEMMTNRVIMSCGKTSLKDFLGLMSKCKLIITNDGGPLHMASAIGVRTVSIFGPVDEKIYGPYPLNLSNIVVSRKDLPCRPCYRKFKYHMCEDRICLKSIKKEDVLKAVGALLSRDGHYESFIGSHRDS